MILERYISSNTMDSISTVSAFDVSLEDGWKDVVGRLVSIRMDGLHQVQNRVTNLNIACLL